MISDRKNLQWYKDAVFPSVMALATLAIAPFIFPGRVVAAHIFAGQVWFLWTWLISLFVSNAVTFIGVILRKMCKPIYIWFEYPGSIVAAFALFVYAGTIAIGNPGGGALAIAVTVVIGFHFVINFMIIHYSVFSKE